MIDLFLSSISVWPYSLVGMLPTVKEHFQGIELLLQPRPDRRLELLRQVIEKAGLKVHFHEVWSLENNPQHFFNHVAAVMGKIPKKTSPLASQLPNPLFAPVVCYAWRCAEISVEDRAMLWLQTCEVYDHVIGYNGFLNVVRNGKYRVVFDTQHVLEFMLDSHGVDSLVSYTPEDLDQALLRAWDDLGEFTTEIHFNNFMPSRGYTGGRNCVPNDGVLNLRSFAQRVLQDKWSGVVVPEVAPATLCGMNIPFTPLPMPFYQPRLELLADMVQDMFS